MILIILFIVLLLIGTPIGVVIGILSLVGMAQIGEPFLKMAPAKIYASLDSFVFLAMPFFILAGEIMNHTGITSRLVHFAKVLVGHYKGGLAQANMVASVFFAGITGSATADAATFGRTLVPAMVKEGYSRPYACAVTAAGSIIGPTIPPSGLMVLYGSLMGVSIAGIFAAGVIPGLLICGICMLMIAFSRKPLPKSQRREHWSVVWKEFKHSFLALLMPFIILGGILGGIVTPTEAAAIAVAYALFLGAFVYRRMTWQDLLKILEQTARINAAVFLIVACAGALGWWLSFMRIPQEIANLMFAISSNKFIIILMIILVLLAFGMVMDIAAILIILGPVIVPITSSIGMHPIHAAILIVLSLNISLMTPPVGACLFVLSSVTNETIGRITKELAPFLLGETAILLIVAYYPELTMWLPRLLGF